MKQAAEWEEWKCMMADCSWLWAWLSAETQSPNGSHEATAVAPLSMTLKVAFFEHS